MKDAKKRKSFKTLAGELSAARKRPLAPAQSERLNKIFEKDVAEEKKEQPAKKIAAKRDAEHEA